MSYLLDYFHRFARQSATDDGDPLLDDARLLARDGSYIRAEKSFMVFRDSRDHGYD
jgi:hypothetical protein